MKMKTPDVFPNAEKEHKETPAQKAIMESFVAEANVTREIGELKLELKIINQAGRRPSVYSVIDKRMGEDETPTSNDEKVLQIEARIKELEEIKKEAVKSRGAILNSNQTEESKGIEPQKSELEIAQEEFLKSQEAEKLERLTDEELADQMERNKENLADQSKTEAIEPDKIIPLDKNDGKKTITDIKPEYIREVGSFPIITENSAEPNNEQKIEFLQKLLEQQRREYVVRDYNMDKNSSALKKFLGIGKRSQLKEFNREYEDAKLRYEDTLKAFIREKSRGGMISSEKAKSLTNFIVKGERARLEETRTEIRIENSPRFERLKRGSQKIIDRYRKLPLWAKFGISGGLIASGVGAAAIGGYRVFCGVASTVGYKQMFEGIANKLQDKKDIKTVKETVKNSKIEGMGAVQRELLLKNLDAAIQNIDKKAQKQKMWKRMRTFMAVGAGVGTAIVGRTVGQYIGEKFHEASEFISEKYQSLTESFQGGKLASGSGAYLTGLENMDMNDVPDFNETPGSDNIVANPVENGEQFSEMVNKPLEDLKAMETPNLDHEGIRGALDENKLAEHFSGEKIPETISKETPINTSSHNFDNLANKPLEEFHQGGENHITDDKIPEIDQRTASRVFAPEGKIEDLHDFDQHGPQHNFDPVDEVKAENNIKNVMPENTQEEIPETVKIETAPAGEAKQPEIPMQNQAEDVSAPKPEEIIPEQNNQEAPLAENYLSGVEHVNKIDEGINRIIEKSSDPNEVMVYLRKELCHDDIGQWRSICLNPVENLIAEKSPGGLGGELDLLIHKLSSDWGLGNDINPLKGETVESWTRRAGEVLMESKK
jgi:hypothetical protein